MMMRLLRRLWHWLCKQIAKERARYLTGPYAPVARRVSGNSVAGIKGVEILEMPPESVSIGLAQERSDALANVIAGARTIKRARGGGGGAPDGPIETARLKIRGGMKERP
jgi:hypothetical protein